MVARRGHKRLHDGRTRPTARRCSRLHRRCVRCVAGCGYAPPLVAAGALIPTLQLIVAASALSLTGACEHTHHRPFCGHSCHPRCLRRRAVTASASSWRRCARIPAPRARVLRGPHRRWRPSVPSLSLQRLPFRRICDRRASVGPLAPLDGRPSVSSLPSTEDVGRKFLEREDVSSRQSLHCHALTYGAPQVAELEKILEEVPPDFLAQFEEAATEMIGAFKDRAAGTNSDEEEGAGGCAASCAHTSCGRAKKRRKTADKHDPFQQMKASFGGRRGGHLNPVHDCARAWNERECWIVRMHLPALHAHTRPCGWVRGYVCVYTYVLRLCLYLYLCICICIYICIYTHINIYMHININPYACDRTSSTGCG